MIRPPRATVRARRRSQVWPASPDKETGIPTETGAFIHAMPYHAGFWHERTPLTHEIRRDGLDL